MKSKMEELFSKQVKNMQVLSSRYSVFLGGSAGGSSNGQYLFIKLFKVFQIFEMFGIKAELH